jgi:predicted Zn finger-like uncharacterized protein
MSIQARCPSCTREYRLTDDYLGKKVRCKECGTVFDAAAPAPAGVQKTAPAAPAPAPRRNGTAAAPAQEGLPRGRSREASTTRPQPRPPVSKALVAFIVVIVLIVVSVPVVGCLGVFFFAYRASSHLQQLAADAPVVPVQPPAPPVQPPPPPPVAEPAKPPEPRPRDVPPAAAAPKPAERAPEKPAPEVPPPAAVIPPVPRPPPLPRREDKPEEHVAWQVQPDPLPQPLKGPFNLTGAIPVTMFGQVILPTAPSSYVAVTAGTPGARDGGLLQVYDLHTLKPVGKPIQAGFGGLAAYELPTLSADGAYLAARPKALAMGAPAVTVWAVATGQPLPKLEVDADPKMKVGLADFLGKDRLFTMKHEAAFPDPGQPATYQTWDLKTGKQVSEFTYNLVFHAKWGSLSPGRRYMVQQETGTVTGYHLLFWELASGKVVGDIEFQGKKDKWGQAAGIAWSSDGEEVAMLWRLGQKEENLWGRILCWDVKTGKQTLDRKVGYEPSMIDALWDQGGASTLQWLPDRSGFLLFGYLVVDRESGAVVWKLPPEPRFSGEIVPRRFLDRNHVTTLDKMGFDRRLRVEALPRAPIDAAVKAARGGGK